MERNMVAKVIGRKRMNSTVYHLLIHIVQSNRCDNIPILADALEECGRIEDAIWCRNHWVDNGGKECWTDEHWWIAEVREGSVHRKMQRDESATHTNLLMQVCEHLKYQPQEVRNVI